MALGWTMGRLTDLVRLSFGSGSAVDSGFGSRHRDWLLTRSGREEVWRRTSEEFRGDWGN